MSSTDAQLNHAVRANWSFIVKENNNELHLVNETDYAQWKDFQKVTELKLSHIATYLESNQTLTVSDREYLNDLNGQMNRAKRVELSNLEDENRQNTVAKNSTMTTSVESALKNTVNSSVIEKKENWFYSLFKRSRSR